VRYRVTLRLSRRVYWVEVGVVALDVVGGGLGTTAPEGMVMAMVMMVCGAGAVDVGNKK
jgi:hypothetical protein